ncbi:Inner membrane protein YbaN [bioreactor metagenome]|uniref:Inner membrane protein YbaN n=1 Tax=bioreactor metagenome TaxID=1076179 RepID=A0A645E8C9_9ZZZZ
MKRLLMIIAGTAFLILGAVGVFAPVLPTTPFLLLTAFFYLRGSSRLHAWLMHHRLFGEYIYNYVHFRAIKKRTKIGTIVFLWAMLILSAVLVANAYVAAVLGVVGIGVTIHLLKLKTLTVQQLADGRARRESSGAGAPEDISSN